MIEFLYLFGEYSLAIYYTVFFQPFVPNNVIYLPLVILSIYYSNTLNFLATGLLFAYSIKASQSLKQGETYAFVGDTLMNFIGVKFNEKHTIVMEECMTVYEYIYQDFKNHFTLDLKDYSSTIVFLMMSFSRGVFIKHVVSSLIGLIILIIIKYVQNYNNTKWYYINYNPTVLFRENYGKILPYPVPLMAIASLIPDIYFKLIQFKFEEVIKFKSISLQTEPIYTQNVSTQVLFDENENLDLSNSESEPEFSEENE